MVIQSYLEPFLDGTPLALERLRLAWSGLSDIDRISLLSTLLADTAKNHKAIGWPHLRKQVVDLALTDNNPYIRYLGAKEVDPSPEPQNESNPLQSSEDQDRFEKVRSDPLFLIRSAYQKEWGKPAPNELDDAASFWKRDHTERLALVNGLQAGGEKVANLLRFAAQDLLPLGVVTIEELVDVLLQYISWKPLSERLAYTEEYAIRECDKTARILGRKSVQALWEAIPDLPDDLTYLLIDRLPLTEGVSSNLSPTLFDGFDEHQLEQLLHRDDIPLKKLRRTLYENSRNTQLRQAAVSSRHFELQDCDISALVYEPMEQMESGKKKLKELALLAFFCKSATQVQSEAIFDLMKDAPIEYYPGHDAWDKAGLEQALETQKSKSSPFPKRQDEFPSGSLYGMAKRLTRMKRENVFGHQVNDTLGQPKQDQEFIVSKNTWQTYLNLKSVVRVVRFNRYFSALGKRFVELSHPEQVLFVVGTVLGIVLLYR